MRVIELYIRCYEWKILDFFIKILSNVENLEIVILNVGSFNFTPETVSIFKNLSFCKNLKMVSLNFTNEWHHNDVRMIRAHSIRNVFLIFNYLIFGVYKVELLISN